VIHRNIYLSGGLQWLLLNESVWAPCREDHRTRAYVLRLPAGDMLGFLWLKPWSAYAEMVLVIRLCKDVRSAGMDEAQRRHR